MTKNNSEVPEGVKIISVLTLAGAAIVGLIGVFFISLYDMASQNPELLAAAGSSISANSFILLGLLMITLGVFEYFVGRGLWKLQNWARFVVLFFSGLGLVMAIISLFQGSLVTPISSLAINGLIVWYLGFSKSVRKAFA